MFENTTRFAARAREALSHAARDVLVDHVRARPRLSVAELGELASADPFKPLGKLTLGELLDRVHENCELQDDKSVAIIRARRPAARPPRSEHDVDSVAQLRPIYLDGHVDARSEDGRKAYDAIVLGALLRVGHAAQAESDQWIGRAALRELTGGSHRQLADALRRLRAQGKVQRTSWLRNPMYSAVRG